MGLDDVNNQVFDAIAGGRIPGPGDGPAWSSALRAAADGELSADRVAALRAQDESFDDRVAFEQGLSAAVGRVLAGPAAPPGLKARVLATVRDGADDADLAARLDERANETRNPSFWGGSARLIGALAAVLVLAVGGLFIARMSAIGPGDASLAYRTSLARFVSEEHQRTLDDNYARAKYIYTEVADAATQTTGELEHAPLLPPCGSRTRFCGASPCGVPGEGPSAHFQFTTTLEGEDRTFSLFVRKDHNELPIEPGRAYRVNTEACNLTDVSIFVWRADGLMYTFVASGSGGSVCRMMLGEMGIAEPRPDESI